MGGIGTGWGNTGKMYKDRSTVQSGSVGKPDGVSQDQVSGSLMWLLIAAECFERILNPMTQGPQIFKT